MNRHPRRALVALLPLALAATAATSAFAQPAPKTEAAHGKLPPGPIHDRHELMEEMGRNAKAIGGAMKAGKPADAARPASDIAAAMPRFLAMFPEGSQGQGSRAKAAVWTDRSTFDQLGRDLVDKATAVAASAGGGGDVSAASKAMFAKCKACHDQFREPAEGE